MTENLGVTRAVWLVARREFGSRMWSRPVLACTVSAAVLLIAFVLVQAYVIDQSRTVRIGLAGQAISLQQELPQEMSTLGVQVSVRSLDSVEQGVEQVRNGQLDVLVSGARSALRVTVDNQLDPRLHAALNSEVRQQILDAQIAQLGARPGDVLAKVDQAQISLTQLNASDPNRGQRVGVGIVTDLVVAWLAWVFAMFAARRVERDGVDGIGEALVPVLRPRRLLSGDLGGTGLTGLAHCVGVAVIGVVVALASGVTSVPSALFAAFGAAVVGFLFAFGLFGLVAVVGVSAGRRGAVRNLGIAMAVVAVVSAVLLGVAPGGAATDVLSVLPPFAPLLLPGVLVAGVAQAWQVLVGIVLTLLAAAGLAWFAGQLYPRSLLRA